MFSTSTHETTMLPFPPRPTALIDRQWKPEAAAAELAPNCPRCDSSNTKFCYYNNYSLSQPRYFCKGCRRYWTKGGSLRNVPVGGGCRKNRRSKPARPNQAGTVNNHPNQVPFRPDLVLDGMVGNGNTGITGNTAHTGKSTDGSTIDLAMLYAKYLNQSPETSSEQSDSFDPVITELPVQLPNHHHGLLDDWQVDTIGENLLFGELGFGMGIDVPGCYESPDLPAEASGYNYGYEDGLYSSCEVLPNLLPDHESLAILQESSIISGTDWSTLDCPNLEALYKC